ncbi:MAG: TetR/AcrR family transcriptional regulator [Saprospiraceae bacterium]|nr:TetR/AcrR family transcriptional regulator [Saprospiraceae bacterium]
MEETLSTEQKIIEAAESVFLADGYAGARMQQIADKAGINKAMLHYYFRSKDKLFELVFRHKMKQFVPQITLTLEDEQIPFLDKLNRFVMLYLEMLRKNPSLPLFILSTMNRNPDLMVHFKQEVGQTIVRVMQAEIKKGNIRPVDPHQFMLTLVGMCIFPFLARPVFVGIFNLDQKAYAAIIAERHLHVMQYARAILSI